MLRVVPCLDILRLNFNGLLPTTRLTASVFSDKVPGGTPELQTTKPPPPTLTTRSRTAEAATAAVAAPTSSLS